MNKKLELYIDLLKDINNIPAPTDGETKLLEYLKDLCNIKNIPFQTVGTGLFNNIPSLLTGKESNHILVIHSDRVSENRNLTIEKENLIGKLDNSLSLSVCLQQILNDPLNFNLSILITTSEEGPDKHGNFDHGGRGFCDYLTDILTKLGIDEISKKYFYCIDTRPLNDYDYYEDVNGEKKSFNEILGLVIRTSERNMLFVNSQLKKLIIDIANENNIPIFYFPYNNEFGSGITELGRGWGKVLSKEMINSENYKISWIQIPVLNNHSINESTRISNIIYLFELLEKLNKKIINIS